MRIFRSSGQNSCSTSRPASSCARGGTILFEEQRFEVAELAVALTQWAGDGTEPDHDFVHDPSSYEETGVVRILRTDDGWAAGSCFITGTTAPQPWPAVRESIDTFVADAHELAARSLLEAGWSIIETTAALRRGLGAPLREAKPLVVRVSGRAPEVYAFQDESRSALKALAADDDALEFREQAPTARQRHSFSHLLPPAAQDALLPRRLACSRADRRPVPVRGQSARSPHEPVGPQHGRCCSHHTVPDVRTAIHELLHPGIAGMGRRDDVGARHGGGPANCFETAHHRCRPAQASARLGQPDRRRCPSGHVLVA
ncbi:hypothetical protein APR03_003354 [Promicromonospora thailandica]|uniref:DUF7878 domain-containing protein n=1 Tax=Promicromonospora thailandica TaxID=765201 RepID=A0A9X2GA73_9MICO|nr:hypothetical protein [Promicromonospora thailandica]